VKLFAVVLVSLASLSLTACNPFNSIFQKMGKDITDGPKYAQKMAGQINVEPRCAQYRQDILNSYPTGSSINGGGNYRLIAIYNNAKSNGCVGI
jgi:predicted small secreted protein